MSEMMNNYDRLERGNYNITKILALFIIGTVLGILLAFVTMAHAYDYQNYYDAEVQAHRYGYAAGAPRTPAQRRAARDYERSQDQIGRYVYTPGSIGRSTYLIEGVPGCPVSQCGYELYTPGEYGNRYVEPR